MSQDRIRKATSGWLMLFINLLVYGLAIYLTVRIGQTGNPALVLPLILSYLAGGLISAGFFIVNPNYAALLVLFGKYKATIVSNGFWWANPLMPPSSPTRSKRRP